MAESARRVAHFSYIEEIDVTALEECRKQLNARFADTRPKLTVLPFVVASLVLALRHFPQINGTYDDNKEVVSRHSAVHVGIATQTPSGLMVPVLFHAEARDLWSCGDEIKRLATAAREGSAKREELSGSTITITSLGDLGGVATTPVINRPELAIIGVNRMMIRPVWRDGQFVPRMMMNLSSSFDHRIVDGYEAAQFIRGMKELLEAPALLLVGN
jgi:2-oxoisovalerate dehydrogenase E2 component (dihydrolipoyl transacylase)